MQLCRHRPGHSLGKKIKLHEMKNKKLQGFSYDKNVANFEALSSKFLLLIPIILVPGLLWEWFSTTQDFSSTQNVK